MLHVEKDLNSIQNPIKVLFLYTYKRIFAHSKIRRYQTEKMFLLCSQIPEQCGKEAAIHHCVCSIKKHFFHKFLSGRIYLFIY